MHPSNRSRRLADAFCAADLCCLITTFGLLVLVLSPSLIQQRKQEREFGCADNLRRLMYGMKIYANDNLEWMPIHYYTARDNEDPAAEHGVTWVGTMGSNRSLRISQPTTPEISPNESHPSRSLFLLITGGNLTVDHFVCPDTKDRVDDLRNYGPDAGSGKGKSTAQPGQDRFDFAGYDRLSYGYQLPYGRKAQPCERRDSRMVIAADKSPYYFSGGAGLTGTRTMRDKRSSVDAPEMWAKKTPAEIEKLSSTSWKKYNSRNHGGKGQNVMYMDGHVAFRMSPLVGVDNDNLYTIQSNDTDVVAGMLGRVPKPTETFGPLTNTDSFLVP